MKTKTSSMAMVVGIGLALGSMTVHAAVDWTWTLNVAPTGSNLPSSAAVMGYSASGNSASIVSTAASGRPDLNWYGGGYGICSTGDGATCGTAPDHAMDNNGYKESILLTFGNKVTLSSVDIDWSGSQNGYDGDISVLAYTGAGNPMSTSYDSIATALGNANSGWKLIGNYANTSQNVTPSVSLNTSVSASYWLVAAYNSIFATGNACKDATTGASATCGDSNDYVKLYAVAGTTGGGGKVPEPSALLLFGTGLMGLVGLRRRAKVNPA